MSASVLLLTAGFAGLVTLGVPFAIAIGVVVTLVLLVADIEPAFLAQQLVAGSQSLQPAGDPAVHAGRRADDGRRAVAAPGRRRRRAGASPHRRARHGRGAGGAGVLGDLGLGARDHGGDRRDPDSGDGGGRLQQGLRRRDRGQRRRARPADPALDRLRDLGHRRRAVDRQAVPVGHRAGPRASPPVCWWSAMSMPSATTCRSSPRPRWAETRAAFAHGKWALLSPLVVLGGIYGGIFTPTEAAGISCVYAVIIGLFVERQAELPGAAGHRAAIGAHQRHRHAPSSRFRPVSAC